MPVSLQVLSGAGRYFRVGSAYTGDCVPECTVLAVACGELFFADHHVIEGVFTLNHSADI